MTREEAEQISKTILFIKAPELVKKRWEETWKHDPDMIRYRHPASHSDWREAIIDLFALELIRVSEAK